ncbi:hypothetical protein GWI33_022828 [Rhynchophorus ferrugineus]|uniref:Uncharacterized protein n=1 Tax=Rhynchophorus ferrugineus TaxID=354439 RepID=A0A834IRL7_RHYFE|nr:hypothetical protein GWI33_022828 [Rhynchophorus ferrugineus]
MFGFSLATQIFQGSTQRTWNCVSRIANLIWGKFIYYNQTGMPRSRKRHHSRSKSRSRSHSPDKNYDKHKKNDSHEKDGKRRRLDEVDSPNHKRSLSNFINSQLLTYSATVLAIAMSLNDRLARPEDLVVRPLSIALLDLSRHSFLQAFATCTRSVPFACYS